MSSLSASETEFLAEQELIVIIPHVQFRDNKGMLNLICGNFGPFHPGIPIHVPLWLAIMLKQLHKCRIVAPPWLSADYLTAQLEREKTSEVFEELPFHYLEVASLLLKNAPEDLVQSEHVRSLLEDLQNVRQDKIRKGLAKIANDVQSGGTALAIQMNNISALEICSVRKFMLGSLNQFYQLAQLTARSGDGASQSQSQENSGPSTGPPCVCFETQMVESTDIVVGVCVKQWTAQQLVGFFGGIASKASPNEAFCEGYKDLKLCRDFSDKRISRTTTRQIVGT